MKFDVVQLESTGIDVIDGDRGKNYPHQNELLSTGFCLFLSAKNVTKSGFSFSETQFISQRKDALLNNGRLCRGDIVITTRGTVGNVALYSPQVPYENIRINSGMLIIRCANNISNQYLYQVLRSEWFQKQIMAVQSGSAQPQLPKSHFLKMNIPLPPLPIQEKIASILQLIDDKITTNNSINDNLEQQVKALFLNYYNQSTTEVRFTDLIQVLGGGTPKTSEISYWNGKIPLFTPKDVGNPYTLNTEKSITEAGLDHCNSRLFPVNTVFVTSRGTVGKVALAGVPMAMNQSCYALIGKDIHQILVYFYTLKAVERLKYKASGAVFDAIITKDFEMENLKKLSNSATEDFIVKAEPVYQLILNNTIENQRLGKLRNTLLPQLMSGELDVSAVEL